MPAALRCTLRILVIKNDVTSVLEADRVQCFEAVSEESFRPDFFDWPQECACKAVRSSNIGHLLEILDERLLENLILSEFVFSSLQASGDLSRTIKIGITEVTIYEEVMLLPHGSSVGTKLPAVQPLVW